MMLVHKTPDQVQNRESGVLMREIAQSFVPRAIYPDKPALRPGEEVYATLFDAQNSRRISHPLGIPGELYWHFGFWAIPLIATWTAGIVFFWNIISQRIPSAYGWLLLHFIIVFVVFENHLVFYFSSMVRVLPLYLAAGVGLHFLAFQVPGAKGIVEDAA